MCSHGDEPGRKAPRVSVGAWEAVSSRLSRPWVFPPRALRLYAERGSDSGLGDGRASLAAGDRIAVHYSKNLLT